MSNALPITPDPDRDLILEREVDVPVALLWKAWTTPEHVAKWFAPAPWSVASCQIDLRPGGIFHTVMRSPEGEDMDGGPGCILEVAEHERLTWTDALAPGFRPNAEAFFTAAIHFQARGSGSLYRVVAIHADSAGRDKHESMGFSIGWGKMTEQLFAHAKTLGTPM